MDIEEIKTKLSNNNNNKPIASGAEGYKNLETIVSNDPFFQDIKFNELSERIEVNGKGYNTRFNARAIRHLVNTYNFLPEKHLDTAISNQAQDNSYNPIKDKLEECLKVYDGQEGHVKKLFIKYLGVEDSKATELIAKTTFLGIIDRALNKGCKYDYCLILYGGQGIGKSSFCRCLALEDKYYNSSLDNIKDTKKIGEAIQGKLIIELEELKAFNRQSESDIKGFITIQSDNYRGAYEKDATDHERSCIFIGTTNKDNFLKDNTGNRRYLPLKCNKVDKHILSYDPKEVDNDFMQAYGEIYSYYLAHNTEEDDFRDFYFNIDSQDAIDRNRQAVTQIDERVDILEDILATQQGHSYEICVSVSYIKKLFLEYYEREEGRAPNLGEDFERVVIPELMKQIPRWKKAETEAKRRRIDGKQVRQWWYDDEQATENIRRDALSQD